MKMKKPGSQVQNELNGAPVLNGCGSLQRLSGPARTGRGCYPQRMEKELWDRVKAELALHDWPEYPLVNGVVVVSCKCGKPASTTGQWRDHLIDEVLFKFIDRPSQIN
jgi:hypothetical protein